MEVKKPITFDQQILKIKEKGFIVNDEAECREFLQRANYYRISAYFLPYKKNDDTYIRNINFRKIIKIYDFDVKMRALLYSIIEEIEIHLRTQFAYYYSHKYGALGYENKDNFNKRHNHSKFEKSLTEIIEKNKTTLIVKHHAEKYDNKFPIWVIVELFTVGMLSYFYSDLLTEDKKAIAKTFDSTPELMESWLYCLTGLRNICAHYSRLYFWNFKSIPKLPKNAKIKITHKLFDQLLMLKFLYFDKDKWNNSFLVQIESLVKDYEEYISFEDMGFARDWEFHLKNKFRDDPPILI